MGKTSRKLYDLYEGEEYLGAFTAVDIAQRTERHVNAVYYAMRHSGILAGRYTVKEPAEPKEIAWLYYCRGCGARIESQHRQYLCDTCKAERAKRRAEQAAIQKRARRAEGARRKRQVPMDKKSPLSRIAAEAAEHHMTYGKYVGVYKV